VDCMPTGIGPHQGVVGREARERAPLHRHVRANP
jgi:hypothetical protein